MVVVRWNDQRSRLRFTSFQCSSSPTRLVSTPLPLQPLTMALLLKSESTIHLHTTVPQIPRPHPTLPLCPTPQRPRMSFYPLTSTTSPRDHGLPSPARPPSSPSPMIRPTITPTNSRTTDSVSATCPRASLQKAPPSLSARLKAHRGLTA